MLALGGLDWQRFSLSLREKARAALYPQVEIEREANTQVAVSIESGTDGPVPLDIDNPLIF